SFWAVSARLTDVGRWTTQNPFGRSTLPPGGHMSVGGARQHSIPILTTFDAPPGMAIDRILGPCWGLTVRSRSVVGQACAGCQMFFGGEISALTQLAADS